jgi:hypothetical protein
MLFEESVIDGPRLGCRWQVPARRLWRRVGALRIMRPLEIPRQALTVKLREASHMNSSLVDTFIIGFIGAFLFMFVDQYEPDGRMANLLKFLVLLVGGLAIIHKLQPLLGIALF